jgi:hypothetical protein
MATAISATQAPVTYVPAAQTSQVLQLYQRGVSPAQIAAILALSAAAVDGYLGIAPAEVVLLPTLAEAPTAVGSPFPSTDIVG